MQQKSLVLIVSATVLGIVGGMTVSCGKKNSGSETPVAPTVAPTAAIPSSAVIAANRLAAAYPEGLALSAFAQTVGLSLLDDNATSEKSVKVKAAEADKVLSGKADSCVPASLKATEKVERSSTCYEFDHDMLYTQYTTNGVSSAVGTRDGTDGNGESCMVSFARTKIEMVVDVVDRTMGMVQVMLCQAKKANADVVLPQKEGDTLDLKAALDAALGGDSAYSRVRRATITAASIERLADVDGKPAYRNKIDLTEPNGTVRTIRLVHSPKSETDNSEFNGVLWTKIVTTAAQTQQQGGAQANNTPLSGMSITYKRSTNSAGEPKVTYELRRGNFATDLADHMFADSGVLNLNGNADFSGTEATNSKYGWYRKANNDYYSTAGANGQMQQNNENQAVQGISFIAFDVNPNTNAGSMAYWQNPGGSYGENARGLVFNMSADATNGILSGCASSGASSTNFSAGISIRKYLYKLGAGTLTATDALQPRGYWHPRLQNGQSYTDPNGVFSYQKSDNTTLIKWVKPTLTDAASATAFAETNTGSFTIRQCFKQDATSGKYAIDTVQTVDAAGYSLVDSSGAQSSRIVSGPDISGVKQLARKVKD